MLSGFVRVLVTLDVLVSRTRQHNLLPCLASARPLKTVFTQILRLDAQSAFAHRKTSKFESNLPEQHEQCFWKRLEVVVPIDGRMQIVQGYFAKHLHADHSVDEEQHCNQQSHVRQCLKPRKSAKKWRLYFRSAWFAFIAFLICFSHLNFCVAVKSGVARKTTTK
jgi:hypothetical protein